MAIDNDVIWTPERLRRIVVWLRHYADDEPPPECGVEPLDETCRDAAQVIEALCRERDGLLALLKPGPKRLAAKRVLTRDGGCDA